MTKNKISHRLLTSLGAIAAMTSAAAIAAVVPLRSGTYVQADTHCADASNATMQTFTGRGFDSADAARCVTGHVTHEGTTYSLAQTCEEFGAPEGSPRTHATETRKIRVLSNASYMDGAIRFRLCPGLH